MMLKRALLSAVLLAASAPGAQAQVVQVATDRALPASGAIALPVGAEGALSGPAQAADRAAGGAIVRAMAAANFKGAKGALLTLYAVGPYERVVLQGVGEGLTSQAELRAYGGRLAIASDAGAATTIVALAPDARGVDDDASEVAIGFRLRAYDWGKVGARAKVDDKRALRVIGADSGAVAVFGRDGSALADGVTLARDLISTPSNIKSPQWFVEQAQAAFQGVDGVTITVLDEHQMQAMGMGGMIGVGRGSSRPPRMLAISYRGAGEAAPIAFVGKGITFDTGGISLKPGDGMWRMRYDMSGAAASVGALLSLARSRAPVNAVAIAALAENMPDGDAIRPGDVLTSMSGKTMEILNTDAEGRIVLADAVWYAQETFKPRAVVTIATLTGAARAALGDDYAALFGNDEGLIKAVADAGERAGEPTWPLPLHESTYDDIRGSLVADVRNIVEGGAPGASIGAAFVGEWIKPGQPWAHLDIAGMAWRNSPTPTIPEGAAGFGVQLFDELARARGN
jgi:leucyl aminopeptidase